MFMVKLGRNDPCHCGSGKKYKKCHLHADQRGRVAIHQSHSDANVSSPFTAVESVRKACQELSRRRSARERNEFGEVLSDVEPVPEYLQHQEEIEAASILLEAHWAEFEKLAADPELYRALSRALFAEECFVPLRFTASDIERAFNRVGYPAMMSPDQGTVEILRAAILDVAEPSRRNRLTMSLLLLLPELVSAGRHLEACILHCSAIQTMEEKDESNPFLFQMFSYGYDAWTADKRAKDESMITRMGLDLDSLRRMSADEIDAWVESLGSDPATAGAMEAFFRENPNLREESTANLNALERNSVALLEREDSHFLQLANHEVEPWLMAFSERASQQGFFSGATEDGESIRKTFEEVALPLMREMADSIFTRDRILQLVADLMKYRGDRFAAGDHKTVGLAMGAINYLKREDSPGQNTFLLNLCWASLESAIKTAETDAPRSPQG